MLSLFFLPPRGPNYIDNFDGGHGRIGPLDPPLSADAMNIMQLPEESQRRPV